MIEPNSGQGYIMAKRLRWDRVEQQRRIAKFGTVRAEPPSAVSKKKPKKAKKKRRPVPPGTGRRIRVYHAPETDDPDAGLKSRLAMFQKQLAGVEKEIRRAEATLTQKQAEARKLKERVAKLKLILAGRVGD